MSDNNKFAIKHRMTDALLFECDLPADIAEQSPRRQLGHAIKEAIKARANLADANLAGANLADANLADANLAGAYLADANLADANLAGARNMPDISAQAIGPAVSAEQAAQERRLPRWEREQRRAQRFRARNPEVPVVEAIDSAILQAVEHGGTLDMSRWHGCGTTHCRAGWAITLAGDAGAQLELTLGPAVAGLMIYLASAGYSPHFYADTSRALEDIKARAAEQALQR